MLTNTKKLENKGDLKMDYKQYEVKRKIVIWSQDKKTIGWQRKSRMT